MFLVCLKYSHHTQCLYTHTVHYTNFVFLLNTHATLTAVPNHGLVLLIIIISGVLHTCIGSCNTHTMFVNLFCWKKITYFQKILQCLLGDVMVC